MTLKSIALTNLRRRKAKAAFVLAGLITGVATMVALVSLADSLSTEINDKLEKYGANILITPKSEQLSLSYEGLSLGGFSFRTKEIRQEDLARITTIKNYANIAAVEPIVLGTVKIKGTDALLAGMEFKSALMLKPWWKIQGDIPAPDQLIAGSEAVRILGLVQGRHVEIKGKLMEVSGVLSPTGSQDDSLIFTHLDTAQSLLDKTGLVSMVEVAALCKDCPVDAMVKQISDVLPDAKVMAIQSVVKGRMETLRYFKNFSYGVSALVALVGSLVVLVTMMGSVKERTCEIGIFRAIGFRRSHIMKVMLIEAALLSAAAGIFGYCAGLGIGELSLPFFTDSAGVHLALNPFIAGVAVLLALTVGLGSSIYPAVTAAGLDPQEALRAL